VSKSSSSSSSSSRETTTRFQRTSTVVFIFLPGQFAAEEVDGDAADGDVTPGKVFKPTFSMFLGDVADE